MFLIKLRIKKYLYIPFHSLLDERRNSRIGVRGEKLKGLTHKGETRPIEPGGSLPLQLGFLHL